MRDFILLVFILIPAFGSQPQPANIRLESFLSTVSNSTLRVTNGMRTASTVAVQTGELSSVRVAAS
jgi:hypothetical protein